MTRVQPLHGMRAYEACYMQGLWHFLQSETDQYLDIVPAWLVVFTSFMRSCPECLVDSSAAH